MGKGTWELAELPLDSLVICRAQKKIFLGRRRRIFCQHPQYILGNGNHLLYTTRFDVQRFCKYPLHMFQRKGGAHFGVIRLQRLAEQGQSSYRHPKTGGVFLMTGVPLSQKRTKQPLSRAMGRRYQPVVVCSCRQEEARLRYLLGNLVEEQKSS